MSYEGAETNALQWGPSPGQRRRRAWVGLVAAGLLPAWALAIGLWWQDRQTVLQQTRAELRSLATVLVQQQRRELDAARQLLVTAGTVPVVQRLEVPACAAFFAALQRNVPGFGNVGAADLGGRVVCSAAPDGRPVDVADRRYFRTAVEQGTLAAEYVVGRFTARPALTLAQPFAGPDGAPAGIAFAAVDLPSLAARLRAVPLPAGLELTLAAPDGTVLASTSGEAEVPGRVLADPALRARVAALQPSDGEPGGRAGAALAVVRPVADFQPTGVVLVLRSREPALQDALAARLRWHLSLLAALGAVLLGWAWSLGRRHFLTEPARQLRRLSAATRSGRAVAAFDEGVDALVLERDHEAAERGRLADAWQRSVASLAALESMTRAGSWTYDPKADRFDGSEATTGLLGGTPMAAIGGLQGLLARVPAGHRARVESAFVLVVQGGAALDVEHPLQLPDGTLAWRRTLGQALPESAAGAGRGVHGAMQDIDDRVRTDELLRRSATLEQIASRVAHLGGWSLDAASGRFAWSREAVRLQAGAPPDVAALLQRYGEQDRERLRDALAACLEHGQGFDLELALLAVPRWLRVVAEAERDVTGAVVQLHGAVADVSERRRAETAMVSMAERLTRTLETLNDGFLTLDSKGRLTYANRRAEQLLERPRDRLLGHRADALFRGTAFADVLARLGAQGTLQHVEVVCPSNGRWIEVHAHPTPDGAAVHFRDVTERRAVDEERQALLQRERAARRDAEAAKLHYRALFESSPGLYLVLEPHDDYRIVGASQAYLDAVGRRREELVGRPLFDVHPDDPDDPTTDGEARLRASLERVREHRRADVMAVQRYPIPRAGGGFEERWWSPLNAPVFDDHGVLAWIIHRVEDVTEFVRGQRHAGEPADVQQALVTRAQRMEADIVMRSQELQRLNEGLQAAQRVARLASFTLHLSDGSLEWSDGLPLAGSMQPASGPERLDALLARVDAAEREAVRRAFARGEALSFGWRHEDGTVHRLELRAHVQHNDAGQAVLVRGTLQDVSERHAADQRVTAQLARLELLQQITKAMADRVDMRGILAIVTRRLRERLPLDLCLAAARGPGAGGFALVEQAPPMDIDWAAELQAPSDGLRRALAGELVHEPDTTRVPLPLTQRLAVAGLHSLVLVPLLAEGSVHGVLVAGRGVAHGFGSGDCEFLRQLGEHVALAVHQAALHEALQRAYDDLRRTQATVFEQERLRALGEMASGIAHDINNAISPLVIYTESLLETEAALSDDGRSKLVTMQRALDDVADTVARMREFYRPAEDESAAGPVDLNALVEQVLGLTQARWRDMPEKRGVHIVTETTLAPGLPAVPGREAELRDALTNLVFNAVDAMPDGGRLRVVTAATAQALGVELRVEDTGIGMDEATRRRCFEPFFTTKGERGTGLGLPMVYGTVQRHGGVVRVDSAPGRGTTVVLWLPAGPVGAPAAAPPVPAAPPPRQRLLVVDNDPLVLEPLVEALERDGHDVTPAPGGAEALAAFEAALQQGEPFDTVLTDRGMPGVDGAAVAQRVKALAPRTRVVMLTGWGRRMVEDREHLPGVDRLLAKPPRLTELRAALTPED
jgi:PAS domain S-box-containing protein